LRQHDNRQRKHAPDTTGGEPLTGSGFEDEQPETDFNGDADDAAGPELEDEQ
jgi:hypothetical protein